MLHAQSTSTVISGRLFIIGNMHISKFYSYIYIIIKMASVFKLPDVYVCVAGGGGGGGGRGETK